jgi:hypothetical protein
MLKLTGTAIAIIQWDKLKSIGKTITIYPTGQHGTTGASRLTPLAAKAKS